MFVNRYLIFIGLFGRLLSRVPKTNNIIYYNTSYKCSTMQWNRRSLQRLQPTIPHRFQTGLWFLSGRWCHWKILKKTKKYNIINNYYDSTIIVSSLWWRWVLNAFSQIQIGCWQVVLTPIIFITYKIYFWVFRRNKYI